MLRLFPALADMRTNEAREKVFAKSHFWRQDDLEQFKIFLQQNPIKEIYLYNNSGSFENLNKLAKLLQKQTTLTLVELTSNIIELIQLLLDHLKSTMLVTLNLNAASVKLDKKNVTLLLQLQKLCHLSIVNTQLKYKRLKVMAPLLNQLRSLKLDHNPIKNSGFRYLIKKINNEVALKNLSLRNTMISKFKPLVRLTKPLHILDLSINKFKDFDMLARALQNSIPVKILRLKYVNFTYREMIALFDALKKNKQCEKIVLSPKDLTFEVTRHIALCLEANHFLREIKLHRCKLDISQLRLLIEGFTQSAAQQAISKMLSLDECRITHGTLAELNKSGNLNLTIARKQPAELHDDRQRVRASHLPLFKTSQLYSADRKISVFAVPLSLPASRRF